MAEESASKQLDAMKQQRHAELATIAAKRKQTHAEVLQKGGVAAVGVGEDESPGSYSAEHGAALALVVDGHHHHLE